MGFHLCEYCEQERRPHAEYSSGDVTLAFTNGHSYVIPDMIVHYVRKHNYLPPQIFVDDVMSGVAAPVLLPDARVLATRIGYLSGDYPQGAVPAAFTLRLADMMNTAAKQGSRAQTRGVL